MPEPNEVPPVEAAYQLTVPAEAVAPKVTVPASHREPEVVPVIVGAVQAVASFTNNVDVVSLSPESSELLLFAIIKIP